VSTLNRVRNNSLPYFTTSENIYKYSIDDAEIRRDKIADKIRVIASMEWGQKNEISLEKAASMSMA
jgi:hypothetical protein